MRKVFLRSFLVASLLEVHPIHAGRFENTLNSTDILDGTQVNIDYNLGVEQSNCNMVLIAPRLAITVSHGGLRRRIDGLHEPVRFNGQDRFIVSKVETTTARVGDQDWTLCLLDRAVDGPIVPLAMNFTPVDNFWGHTLSHNPNIQLGNLSNKPLNPRRQLIYSQTYVNHLEAFDFSYDHDNVSGVITPVPNTEGYQLVTENIIETSMPRDSKRKHAMVGNGGDSGSPLFIQLQDDRFALAGFVTRSITCD